MTLLNAIIVIAQLRWRILRNTFWRGAISRKIRLIVFLLILCGGAWGLYQFSGVLVRGLTSPSFVRILKEAAKTNPGLPTDLGPVLAAVPSVVLFGTMIVLLFSGFSTLLGELYLSGDIDMLLVAPVPMRAVFIVKFFSALLPQYLILAFLLGPLLVGYGLGLGYGWPFVLTTIVVLALVPLLPAGVSALLVMAVVRILPARRARDIVGVLGGVLAAGWFIANQFTPEIAPRIADVRNVGTLVRLNLPLLPSAWAGRALTAAGEGAWLTLLIYGGIFTLLSLALFGACLLLAERLYYAGWSNVAVRGGTVRARPQPDENQQRRGRWLGRLGGLLPTPSAAIIQKDLRLFSRDLRTLQQLIFPLAMAGIWTFRLVVNPRTATSDPIGQLSALAGLGIAFFLCLTLGNVLAGPGVSREGKSFWLTKVAPVSGIQILLGKFVLAFSPYPTAGIFFLLLLLALGQGTAATTLRDAGTLLLIGLGSSAIGLSIGAVFPKFNWDKPGQQTNLQTGCLAPIAATMYSGMIIVAIWGPSVIVPWLWSVTVTGQIALQAAGWVIAIAFMLVIVLSTMRFGAQRLERLEV